MKSLSAVEVQDHLEWLRRERPDCVEEIGATVRLLNLVQKRACTEARIREK